MEESRVTSYDEVTYPSFPIYYTQPDRLATVATLFGMKPAPAEHCRVLEMGCFEGANLASMAVSLPESEFVGVDLASSAIARGRAMAAEVGLKNLTLRHLDLMEMAPDYGQFDYIIAHGVFSWVPEPVREKILAICKGSLAPQGVAYISYNTFPGCHNRLMLREMMLFHNQDFHDPQQRMHQALNLLKLLANSLEKETEPYTKFLKEEYERLSKNPPESLYHDELGEVFVPFYFHEFMEQAGRHGLQFLGEADFFDMVPRGMTPKAVEVLQKIGDDVILREQYLDFMRGRHFRKTLLCHPDVALNRNIKADCVKSYYISTFAKPESPSPSSEPGVKETFQSDAGAKLATADPLARALFWHLTEKNPERIPFQWLATEVALRAQRQFGFVPGPDQDVPADIAGLIWATYRAGLVDLHLHIPPYVLHVSDKPLASPLARWQARRRDVVSTLHHMTLKLRDTIHRGILALLDGSRDRAALRADLLQVFASGTLDLLDEDGKVVTDMSVVGKKIDDELEGFLLKASQTGVLMG
ncbi:MAG: class I SAM-dependent methyltransferase [Acidobacteriota bacterium]|nr:class I SAM-dependent methyltransferase [Acidobacteriota bacterium]